jgi:hypothetical protein
LPKINLTAHLRKRRKTDILRRINIGSEAFKLLLSVFFSRHEAMTCRPQAHRPFPSSRFFGKLICLFAFCSAAKGLDRAGIEPH